MTSGITSQIILDLYISSYNELSYCEYVIRYDIVLNYMVFVAPSFIKAMGEAKFKFLANQILQKRAYTVLGHELHESTILGHLKLIGKVGTRIKFHKTHIHKAMSKPVKFKPKL